MEMFIADIGNLFTASLLPYVYCHMNNLLNLLKYSVDEL